MNKHDKSVKDNDCFQSLFFLRIWVDIILMALRKLDLLYLLIRI